jgi:uncharacterized membrane protein
MHPSRWRRQEGLIREALYVFLAIAVVMAVLLDGVALFTVQQDARDDASDAALEAKQEYAQTGSVDQARAAAAQHVEANDADLVGFTVTRPTGSSAVTFTVTVQHHAETYIFKYLEYIPGLDEWVEDVQNPTITRSTE